MCKCFASTHACALCAWSAHRGHKQMTNPLHWLLLVVSFMWELGREAWFCKRRRCSNCWPICPAPFLLFSITCICVCVYIWVCACESEYLGYRGTRWSWSEVTHSTGNLTQLLCRRNVLLTLTAEHLCNPDIHNLNNKKILQVNKCNKDRIIYEVQIFLLCWKDHVQCLLEQADSSTGKQHWSIMDMKENFRK